MYNRYGFFSYKRGAGADSWYEESKNQIESYVRAELESHDYGLFFDRESIPSGSHWEEQIQIGLDTAPVLIAFFSPAYFNSPWCMAELQTFLDREDTLGLQRGTLIHPATISDARHFPSWAQALQATEFCEHYVILPSFWETRRASDYSIALRDFAAQIVEKLQSVPPYREDFPVVPSPDPPTLPPTSVASLFAPIAPIAQPFSSRRVA